MTIISHHRSSQVIWSSLSILFMTYDDLVTWPEKKMQRPRAISACRFGGVRGRWQAGNDVRTSTAEKHGSYQSKAEILSELFVVVLLFCLFADISSWSWAFSSSLGWAYVMQLGEKGAPPGAWRPKAKTCLSALSRLLMTSSAVGMNTELFGCLMMFDRLYYIF